jgi:Holliday junction DNA helicase RuvA
MFRRLRFYTVFSDNVRTQADKIAKTQAEDSLPGIQTGIQTGQVATEAVTALVTLGFPQAASQKVVQAILKEEGGLSVEAVIREALKRI